jgi:putative endonuclease
MADLRKELGNKGEQLVAQHLERDGFTIRALNYSRKTGEIDVIAQKDELVVFVEVKVRQKNYFHLSSVIDHSKQQKIIKTAQIYSTYNQLSEHILRFDVALVQQEDGTCTITYIPNAFTAPSI